MVDIWAIAAAWVGSTIVVVGLFVRIEHRLTKVETLMTVIAVRVGICQPNLEKDGQ